MSYLIQKDCVRYECSCGSLATIAKLYFCRHCLELRCGYCVYHEVDSHYCSNCMEHLPATEAKLKKNRCNPCFDCPNCFHTLSVRATTRTAEDSTAKTPVKHYYLACFFCRWTTRDVGIPDQLTATSNWPVMDNPHGELLTSYLEYYKMVGMRERSQKEQKEKKILTFRRGYSSYTEKFGLTAMIARKRAGLPPLHMTGNDLNTPNLPQITPCVASDKVTPLPDSYFTEVPDLTKVTTIAQRHSNPMLQPEIAASLHPQHRHFNIKRSLRCRVCEHNVSKPEYNPGSIKFKIQLSAYYHMPEIKIIKFEPLRAGEKSEIVLKVTNPTQHMTSLHFGPFVDTQNESQINRKIESEATSKKAVRLPRPIHKVEPNAHVDLPDGLIVLPPRDDAAEYDDSSETHNFQDDPKVVVWRKGNKAAVRFIITPNKISEPKEKVVFVFSIEYGYVNTMPTLEQKQPQRVDMQVNVFVSPGEVIGKTKEGPEVED